MNTVQRDINSIVAKAELFDFLNHASLLITGATGLIGSMMIKTIHDANKRYGLGIRLVGQIRDEGKAKEVFNETCRDIELVQSYDGVYDYIIHTVSPTASKFFVTHPVETIRASVESTIAVLETAKKTNASLVYLSSMEQYGVPYEPGLIMKEDKIGIIDHLNIRASYSESKRLCECLCASYAAEYGLDVKIARLAQTFGAGIPLSDNRMPMQFARAAVEGRNIVLHTEGRSVSNFVYLTDAIIGILTILKKGKAGQAYNVCNDQETRTVREIAELVCSEINGGEMQVNVEKKDNMGYAPDVTMYLDSAKLRDLGWRAEVDMIEAYRRLTQYIRESVYA